MNDTSLYHAQQWEFRCSQDGGSAQGWRWCCRAADGMVIASGPDLFPSLGAAIEDARRNGFRYESVTP